MSDGDESGDTSGSRARSWLANRWVRLGGAAVLLVVIAGVALWWFVFRGDAPAAVDLETAVAQVEGGGASGTDNSEASDGIAGTWTLDTTIGDFDFETATGSFAGYRVDEELTIGEVTAVGRTGDVSGTIELTDTELTGTSIEVNMRSIVSDRNRRDGRTRTALNTNDFQFSTFVLTESVALPAGAADGEAFAVDAVGDLSLAGITRQVVFALEAQLVGDTVVVVGSTEIQFDDYEIDRPSAGNVLSIEDHGIIEFQLLFTK